jgi:hypothetical protein
LKKVISILFIALFFTAQYARQLAYLECKLAAGNATEAAQCDCEKQTGIDKTEDKELPPGKSHTHISVDEFFSNPANETDKPIKAVVFIKPAAVYARAESSGNSTPPYHPPEA